MRASVLSCLQVTVQLSPPESLILKVFPYPLFLDVPRTLGTRVWLSTPQTLCIVTACALTVTHCPEKLV